MTLTVTIDGNDVTNLCVAGSWTRRLNRPSQASVTIPFTDEVGGPGSRLKIVHDGTIVFHGMCLLVETNPEENFGYTIYNATDPMELWQWRPVRDDTCDFSLPQIITDYVTGPQIVEAMLRNTSGDGGGCCDGCDCVDADAKFCEGPIFLDIGTFEGGGVSLEGVPTDWPMTIAQLTSLLVSTGCLDVIITPTDPGGGVMGTVDGYNGDYGTDHSGTVDPVVFQYGTGAYNISKFRRVQDMTSMCNKLWYYMGPRIATESDPAGDQHWCYNITGTDSQLPLVLPNGVSRATLLADRLTSRGTYGTRMDIQIFDAAECVSGGSASDCCQGDPSTALYRELYRNRWETESWIRQQPRELVYVTPTRDTAIGDFDIGDLIAVEIPILSISAAQRVYEYTVSWSGDDSVLAYSELQTSPTADA
jgi:hypothetical protein